MTLYKVMMAGQDITSHVQETSIHLTNNLGQGPGVGQGSSGRAATCEFDCAFTVGSAVGAGSTISSPTLVRMGEVLIYDYTGTLVFGGYAGIIDDSTLKKSQFVHVQCYDYWQQLDRIIVHEVYNGVTDVAIILDLISKYAPWLDVSLIPSAANYTFSTEALLHKSLQWALQDITDKAGQIIWIGPDKKVHYIPLNGATSAAYSISDTGPFNSSNVPARITKYEVDDTSAINRVYFYGGNYLSGDFTQDISTQANGNNTLFAIAYYPHESSDGKCHLYQNGVELAIGYVGSDTAKPINVLKPAGTADALINRSGKTIQYAVAPAGGSVDLFKYRYELPLAVVVTDAGSLGYYGMYLDASISDNTVIQTYIAVQRCKVLLAEQNYGLTVFELHVKVPGLVPGTIMRVDKNVRNIHGNFIIQSVEGVFYGGGYVDYTVTLGAWHWNVTDILMRLLQELAPTDPNVDGTGTNILQLPSVPGENVGLTWTVATSTRTQGGYYPRSAPAHDGHDAYPGLASV